MHKLWARFSVMKEVISRSLDIYLMHVDGKINCLDTYIFHISVQHNDGPSQLQSLKFYLTDVYLPTLLSTRLYLFSEKPTPYSLFLNVFFFITSQ